MKFLFDLLPLLLFFAALRVADIYVVDLATGALTNVTKDAFADYAPAFSPDGRALVYTARISGNDKLSRSTSRRARKSS